MIKVAIQFFLQEMLILDQVIRWGGVVFPLIMFLAKVAMQIITPERGDVSTFILIYSL